MWLCGTERKYANFPMLGTNESMCLFREYKFIHEILSVVTMIE